MRNCNLITIHAQSNLAKLHCPHHLNADQMEARYRFNHLMMQVRKNQARYRFNHLLMYVQKPGHNTAEVAPIERRKARKH